MSNTEGLMKRRLKPADIERMRSEDFVKCPLCGHHIKPAEMIRTDGEHILCPACEKEFVEDRSKAMRTG